MPRSVVKRARDSSHISPLFPRGDIPLPAVKRKVSGTSRLGTVEVVIRDGSLFGSCDGGFTLGLISYDSNNVSEKDETRSCDHSQVRFDKMLQIDKSETTMVRLRASTAAHVPSFIYQSPSSFTKLLIIMTQGVRNLRLAILSGLVSEREWTM